MHTQAYSFPVDLLRDWSHYCDWMRFRNTSEAVRVAMVYMMETIRDEESVRNLIQRAEKRYGRIRQGQRPDPTGGADHSG